MIQPNNDIEHSIEDPSDEQLDALKTPFDYLCFFKAIPEEKWVSGHWRRSGQRCALGHLGFDKYGGDNGRTSLKDCRRRLERFVGCSIPNINDGENCNYMEPTPRHRIISAIQDAIGKLDMDTVG